MTKLLKVCAVLVTVMMVASTASANLLGNPGFETPVIVPPPNDVPGAGAPWTSFGSGIFTVNSVVVPPNSGNQALKLFGPSASGAFQQFPANPNELWNGGAWMRNDTVTNGGQDAMGGGQVGAVNIEWIQADGSTPSAITPFISNGTFTTFPCAGCAAPPNAWTLQTITGPAPADAAFARFVVITGDFQPGGPAGAVYMDDAFFELVPEPGSFGLLSVGLLSLLGLRRRS